MKKIAMRGAVALLLLGMFIPAFADGAEDQRAEVSIAVGGAFGRMVIRPKVVPFAVYKNKSITKQGLDYSCGAAAAATIFNSYLDVPISEEKVIDALFKAGDVDKIIARKGFSLLDIKNFAESMGYRAVGYKTDVEGLVSLDKPSIVAILLRDYKHFVVFRGMEKDRVFLADPAIGNTTLSRREFEQMWFGQIALVIEPREERYRNDLKISDRDKTLVDPSELRRSIYYSTILFGKGSGEF